MESHKLAGLRVGKEQETVDYRRNYMEWLEDFTQAAVTMEELLSISENEKEIEDRFYQELSFGTAGMRGIIGAGMNRINIYTVRRATQGLAEYLKQDPAIAARGVVIAYDNRRNSDLFAKETALVLCGNGIPAFLFDALRPVALLSFGVRHLKAAAGVVITASHNPPQYNGYKVYGEDGAQIGPETAEQVTRAISATSFTDVRRVKEDAAKASGLLRIIGNREVDDAYIQLVKALSIYPNIVLEAGKDLRIVYTPLHGSGNVPVRRVLREMGITNVSVVKQQEDPDPNFSTIQTPNPEDPAAFAMAMKLADEVHANVIIATDPDCDRVGVAVREKNGGFRLLTGNQIGCMLLYYILAGKKAQGILPQNGAVVKSIVSSELARAICESYGVRLFDTLTGFKFIGEKIQQFEDGGEYTFLFGFEESYGFLSGTFVRDKDGVNASMLIAEAAAYYSVQGKTLSDIMEEILNTFGYYLEFVSSKTLPGVDGLKVMVGIMERIRTMPPGEVGGLKVIRTLDFLQGTETVNGITKKLDYPESDVFCLALEGGCFIFVRPSGTEPKIKLYVNVNHPDEEKAKALLALLAMEAEKMLFLD